MRVTQSMLSNNMLRNISNSYERMGKYQDQLATGKKVNRPSDDPVVAMKGMYYRTNLTEVEQYKRNLGEVYNWMDNSDAGLDQATSVLQRARELVIYAKNDTNTSAERKAIAVEIKQLKEDLVSIANTRVAGKYIFNGTDISKKPVDIVAGQVQVNHNTPYQPYVIEVSNGIQMATSVNPEEAFSKELFAVMDNIQVDLEGNDVSQLAGYLETLDNEMNEMLAQRADLGARYNRVELIDSRINQQEVIAHRILSENEDADIERVITDLKSQESVHRAALSVGARIMQPTLMDFLR